MRPKVGLVLGGGGSRGLAHIGVLKVFEREKIPVDYIVGTSMGSIVGISYALGYKPDEIESYMSRLGKTNLLSLNVFSAKSRQKAVEERLKLVMKDKTFADLQIPSVVMAVDMLSGKEEALCEGELIPAILASSAVPAVFPPVIIDGKQLADGGVIDSTATAPAYNMGAEVVIVVDVYPPLEQDGIWVDPISATMGFELPFNVFGTDKTPGMVSSLWRSFRVMTWYTHEMRLKLHPPHVLLRPAVEGYGSLDFKDIQGPIQAGVEEAEAHLEHIIACLNGEAGAPA
jgi:NTE family protein